MHKLNYNVLDALAASKHALEVTNIDVKRLRDDRAEIQAGQEIAFVATASFRITSAASEPLKRLLPGCHIAVGDELLVIGADAELRSEALEIDADSVALWLAKRYAFGFLLNGKASGAFREVGHVSMKREGHDTIPRELALPWLAKLQTAMVKDDYFDVDVHVTENPVEAPPSSPLPPSVVTIGEAMIPYHDTQREGRFHVALGFHLDGKSTAPEALIGQTFRLGLKADHSDVQLQLILSISKC